MLSNPQIGILIVVLLCVGAFFLCRFIDNRPPKKQETKMGFVKISVTWRYTKEAYRQLLINWSANGEKGFRPGDAYVFEIRVPREWALASEKIEVDGRDLCFNWGHCDQAPDPQAVLESLRPPEGHPLRAVSTKLD